MNSDCFPSHVEGQASEAFELRVDRRKTSTSVAALADRLRRSSESDPSVLIRRRTVADADRR